MKKIHLVCNAHLDPMWLWEWEEGAAEAISTFRVAADFCEQYDGFVFNHNEVTLYKWVEEYEPALFQRIQRLVKEGKWHIMGGWYLQPDCNIPCGESIVRQALIGKQYFMEKFGVEPTTAINFDPFGHSRGLVQILAKSGYDSYVFCRPNQNDCPLPADDILWEGFDGSRVMAHRAFSMYNSMRGQACNKVEQYRAAYPDKDTGFVLWGIGNHGGGPSRIDLENLAELMQKDKECEIVHSTPEQYFEELKNESLPVFDKGLNPWAVGCYTSQVRIKQKHSLLENELYTVEKMMSHAALCGKLNYPAEELHDAEYDLLAAEFHDILPGTSIQAVEECGIRLMDHALETLSRLKARAFFALADGQKRGRDGEVPVLAYNPHPYPIKGIFEIEFNLPDMNWEETFTNIHMFDADGKEIPAQVEKEVSNHGLDWRKHVTFAAELAPSAITRFDCRGEVLPKKPAPALNPDGKRFVFDNGEMQAVINCETGFLDSYQINGKEYIKPGAFTPVVMKDDDDPWGMRVKSFQEREGAFTLMDKQSGTAFSGVTGALLDSVRVIEDGPVRSVIEAVLEYQHSNIVLNYKLPKTGTEIEVSVRVHWNEKSRMLKLTVPTIGTEYFGQVVYGFEQLRNQGEECVSHKWVAATDDSSAVTLINSGLYGSSFKDGEIQMTLLRSPGYSGHPIYDRVFMEQDRYSPRIDQGERLFTFWLNAGQREERFQNISREAETKHQKPFILSFFPSGDGEEPEQLYSIDNPVLTVSALKLSEDSSSYILRLFEPTGSAQDAVLTCPALGMDYKLSMQPFEIKTLKIDPVSKTVTETNLLERA